MDRGPHPNRAFVRLAGAPFAVVLLAIPLSAQSILTIPPQQCVWHAGDNPAWAAPTLDLSGWHSWDAWNPKSLDPRIWIRCHADLSSLQKIDHPALQITLYAAYQAYFDGRLIGSAGNLKTGGFTMNIIREWPLSGDLAPPAVIALRITRRVVSTIPIGPAPPLAMSAGSSDLLGNRRSAIILTQVAPRIFPAVCFCILGVLAVVLLPLWFNDPSRRELLLLSASCAALPFIYLNYTAAAALCSFPVSVYFALWAVPASVANITRALFFFALARRRVPLIFWILIIAGNGLYMPAAALSLFPAAQALAFDSLRSHHLDAIGDVFHVLENLAPFAAFLPWSSVARRMKPLAALSMAWGVIMMALFTVRLTSAHIPDIPNLQIRWANAVADGEAIAILSLVIALLFLLFREQQQTARERAILAGEMQAAQQVQCMLAPSVLDTVPGMRIDVAFHPIREVGGDFYSCRILPGNRQRILLGDVSGKGAAAAMTAAVLIGAAQRRDHESPAALLAHLNHVLADMSLGGFATCLCAELSATGALILANAGHLPPYRNGEEIPLDSGLPLGITADGTYGESTLALFPGDQLTLLSDGIVEARSATGELFGFDRTLDISSKSAEEIAQAAHAFGQEDDITVLTLNFAPADDSGNRHRSSKLSLQR
ncbi:MAG TPA: PP2C family protein-serine/threonine phosphatase [Acidobacteriaceae bacterium]|nr:PP2C family protein-serine/threonine phosphatase [Acidobacteriaceae bacterium]